MYFLIGIILILQTIRLPFGRFFFFYILLCFFARFLKSGIYLSSFIQFLSEMMGVFVGCFSENI